MNWRSLFSRRRRIIERLIGEVTIDGQECAEIEAAFRLMVRSELKGVWKSERYIDEIAEDQARRFTLHLARVRSERRSVA